MFSLSLLCFFSRATDCSIRVSRSFVHKKSQGAQGAPPPLPFGSGRVQKGSLVVPVRSVLTIPDSGYYNLVCVAVCVFLYI